jgi:outer membrane cobalamin receptor
MNRHPALSVFAALFVLLFAARVSAQQTASLTGTVFDPSGAAIAGAKVTLVRTTARGAILRTTSGPEGRYGFDVVPGAYRLRVAAASFAPYEQDLQLAPGERRELTVRLALDRASASVIVTAEPLPAPEASVAAPVDVITQHDIETLQITSLTSALSTLSGASIGQSGRTGGVTSLFLDGGNSNYAKVLVDGVPLNTPGGAVDFSPFTLDDVSKIEVVHGAESALYGSDAMAGVIQVFTARGSTREPELDLVGEGGNFSSARGAATLSGIAGPFDYLFGFARFDTDGQGVNDAFRDETFSGNFGWQFNPANSIRLVLRNNTSNAGIQGQILLTPPELDEFEALHDFSAALSGDFATGSHWRHHVLISEAYLRQIFDNPLSSYYLSPDPFGLCTGLPRSPHAVPSPNFCDYTFSSFNQFNRVNLDAQTSYLGREGSITAGYAYEVENGWLSDIGSHARRNNQAGYIEARYQFTERLTGTAGVRAEDNSNFGTRVVPRLGLAFLARKGGEDFGATRLHVSYGLGIKEPSLDQSFGTDPCFPGDPNLRPERSSSVHAGVDQYFAGDRIRVSLDGFYNRFHDLISFGEISLAGCGFAGTYFNTDLAQAGGINLKVEAKAARWLRIGAGYAYDDSLVIKSPNAFDPATVPGNRLLRRPLNSGSLTARAAWRQWHLNLTGYYSGSRTDSDFLGLGLTRTPPYARFDLSGGYALGHGVELFGRVQNLLDRQYQLILGFPALGREFRGGVKYRLGGRS